jgi:hypothetical protein
MQVLAPSMEYRYELEVLLSLDGQEFDFAAGYIVKYTARQVASTKTRPGGVKYSFALHGPDGKRIYGIDNVHETGRRGEFDHRHVHGSGKVIDYHYRNPVPSSGILCEKSNGSRKNEVCYEQTRPQ